MNTPENTPKNKTSELGDVVKRTQIESDEKLPVRVNDLRDSRYKSFDLEKFLNVIERLRREGLFKITREFEDSDYGKYMSVFASSESDHWAEAVKEAKAIEITLTTPSKNFGVESRMGRTNVELKILMGEKEGRVFTFNFNRDGKYYNGSWYDVHLQKRLGDSKGEGDFTLSVESTPETKKLE